MGLANCGDLLEVMVAVNEMEAAPVRDGERAEDVVGDATSCAKDLMSFSEEGIEASELLCSGVGEFATGEWM